MDDTTVKQLLLEQLGMNLKFQRALVSIINTIDPNWKNQEFVSSLQEILNSNQEMLEKFRTLDKLKGLLEP